MDNTLFVGGLPFDFSQDQLQKLFAAHGVVKSVKIIFDRASGASRGFGFVEMGTEEGAKAALEKLNGSTVAGRTILITQARPKEPPPAAAPDPRKPWERPVPPPVDKRPLNEKRLRLLVEHEPPKPRPAPPRERKPWEDRRKGPGGGKPYGKPPERKPWSKPRDPGRGGCGGARPGRGR